MSLSEHVTLLKRDSNMSMYLKHRPQTMTMVIITISAKVRLKKDHHYLVITEDLYSYQL